MFSHFFLCTKRNNEEKKKGKFIFKVITKVCTSYKLEHKSFHLICIGAFSLAKITTQKRVALQTTNHLAVTVNTKGYGSSHLVCCPIHFYLHWTQNSLVLKISENKKRIDFLKKWMNLVGRKEWRLNKENREIKKMKETFFFPEEKSIRLLRVNKLRLFKLCVNFSNYAQNNNNNKQNNFMTVLLNTSFHDCSQTFKWK